MWLSNPRRREFSHVALVCLGLLSVLAQGQQAQPYEFFSGDVVELTPEKLTVERKVRGKDQQRHTFVLRPDTKIEGKLLVKARVTVGFKNAEGVDVAVRVIVRPKPAPVSPTKGF
ncbi:MAG: hypothetical protein ABI693_09280 [Bryobacteraceae bacterium]